MGRPACGLRARVRLRGREGAGDEVRAHVGRGERSGSWAERVGK